MRTGEKRSERGRHIGPGPAKLSVPIRGDLFMRLSIRPIHFFRAALVAGASLLLVQHQAVAQPGNSDQIRKQIQALEAQLQKAENSRNVTQIGSSRRSLRDPSLVVRIYDLGDLFAVAPPYPAELGGTLSKNPGYLFPSPTGEYSGSGFGGLGGGGFFSTPADVASGLGGSTMSQAGSAQSVRTSQEELISTIKKTISPEMWDEAGGPATIAKLGNAFVISADEETHKQVDSLLNLFRKRWGTLRTVSVRAHWLWLGDADLNVLMATRSKDGDPAAFGAVVKDEWKKAVTEASKNGRSGYRSVVTCYNGQTVHTLSGGQSNAITNMSPKMTEGDEGIAKGRIAYRPNLTFIQEGAALQVTPITNVSGRYVLLDIHSRICLLQNKLEKLEKLVQTREGGDILPQEVADSLDRPQLNVQRLSTTLRVPVGQPYLVGGMTFSGVNQDVAKDLYLFVEVAVQELRDDLEDEGSDEAHSDDSHGKESGEEAIEGDESDSGGEL